MNKRKLKILLADDHQITREGIKTLLKKVIQSDFDVVEVSDGEQAVQAYREQPNIDLVIMDVRMPVKDGIVACREIVGYYKHARILFFSMYNDPISIKEAMEAGGSGYLTKNVGVEEVAEAISKVLKGERYVCADTPHVPLGLNNRFNRNTKLNGRQSKRHLTHREQEVLFLISSEKTTVEIASVLMVNIKTVEKYRKKLIDKFSAKTSVGLIKRAMRDGWIVSGENMA